jgi:hypothetical protein
MAMGISNGPQRARIAQNVLRQTAIKYANNNMQESPVAMAMNQLFELMEQWVGKLGSPDEQAPMRGSVLLYAVDGPGIWPTSLFAGEMPANFQQALSECHVIATPDLSVTRMVPQPFDNALLGIKLPTAVGKLTKDLSPSFLAKAIALVWSGVALLSGNRLR